MKSLTLFKVDMAYGFVSCGTVVIETLLRGGMGEKYRVFHDFRA